MIQSNSLVENKTRHQYHRCSNCTRVVATHVFLRNAFSSVDNNSSACLASDVKRPAIAFESYYSDLMSFKMASSPFHRQLFRMVDMRQFCTLHVYMWVAVTAIISNSRTFFSHSSEQRMEKKKLKPNRNCRLKLQFASSITTIYIFDTLKCGRIVQASGAVKITQSSCAHTFRWQRWKQERMKTTTRIQDFKMEFKLDGMGQNKVCAKNAVERSVESHDSHTQRKSTFLCFSFGFFFIFRSNERIEFSSSLWRRTHFARE